MPKKESRKESSSSSSDSEDDLIKQQLKEATVSFDQIASTSTKAQTDAIKLKSKRFVEDDQDNDDAEDSFKLTPEFQDFVAKKLRSKLDE